VRVLAEVVVDRHLVEVVHRNSGIKVNEKTDGTKKPRDVREKHRGAFETLDRPCVLLNQSQLSM
jgi:hypothetical protein